MLYKLKQNKSIYYTNYDKTNKYIILTSIIFIDKEEYL